MTDPEPTMTSFYQRRKPKQSLCLQAVLWISLASLNGVFASKPYFVEEPQNVTAFEDSDVSLQCEAAGNPRPEIVWFHNDVRVSLPSNNFKLLTDESSNSIQQVLTIMKVSSQNPDTFGSFLCIADNKHGSVTSDPAIVTLNYLNPKFKAPLENQAIPRGGHARIQCHQPDGNPRPQVTWLKNEIAINFETNARLKLLNDGALLISQVRDSDRGSYKCVVTNGIARYVNGPADITVGDTPVILLDPTTGFNLNKGDRLNISCFGRGDPVPRVWWEDKDSNKILTDRKTLQKAVLSISDAGNADNGKYVCHANNSVGQANKEVEVIVSEPPKFVIEPVDTEAEMNGTVKVSCKMQGNPTVNIFWEDSSGNIIFSDQETGNKLVDSEGTLHIRNFGIPDIGRYKCVGDNGHGQLSARIEIKLKELPSFPPIIDICPISVNLSSHQLSYWESFCSIINPKRSDKVKVTFDWLRNGQSLLGDSRFLVTNNVSSSRLRIYQFKKNGDDDGQYVCQASNEFGTSKCSAIIQFTSQADRYTSPEGQLTSEPSTPLGIVLNSTSVLLQWNAPSNIRYLNSISYQIEYFYNGLGKWVLGAKNIKQTSAIVTDLIPSMKYYFIVRARNLFGTGRPSKVSEGLFLTNIPKSEEEMSAHWMYNNSAFIRKQILTAGVEVQEPIAISSTAVRVAWDVARNTQYITGFYIMHKEKGSAFVETISHVESGIDRSFILKRLRPYTDYAISIQAYFTMMQQHEVGKQTRVVYVRTRPDLPSESPQAIKASLNQSSLLVTWNPPPRQYWNSQYLTGYHIWVYTNDMNTIKNHTVDNETFSVTYQMLPKTDELWFQMAALNQVPGHGLKSEIIKVKIGLGAKKSFWTEAWFIAVVGAILWAILVFVAIWLYRRFQAARYRYYSECDAAVKLENQRTNVNNPHSTSLARTVTDPLQTHWGSRPCSQCGGHVSLMQNCPDLIRQGKQNEYQQRALATGTSLCAHVTLPRYIESSGHFVPNAAPGGVNPTNTTPPPGTSNYHPNQPQPQQPYNVSQSVATTTSALPNMAAIPTVGSSSGSSNTSPTNEWIMQQQQQQSHLADPNARQSSPSNNAQLRNGITSNLGHSPHNPYAEIPSSSQQSSTGGTPDGRSTSAGAVGGAGGVGVGGCANQFASPVAILTKPKTSPPPHHPPNYTSHHSPCQTLKFGPHTIPSSTAQLPDTDKLLMHPSASLTLNLKDYKLFQLQAPHQSSQPYLLHNQPIKRQQQSMQQPQQRQSAYLIRRNGSQSSLRTNTTEKSYAVIGGDIGSSDTDSVPDNDISSAVGDRLDSLLPPPPPGEPPSSDIESLYQQSTVAPSSVYSMEPGVPIEEDPEGDLRDPQIESPLQYECVGYETAFPQDETNTYQQIPPTPALIKPAMYPSPSYNPQIMTPENGIKPCHCSHSLPTGHGGYFSESDVTGTSQKESKKGRGFKASLLNQKRNLAAHLDESNSVFAPILAPRQNKKCVPKKLLKPTVALSAGTTPVQPVDTSQPNCSNLQTLSNDPSCQSCYCSCQQYVNSSMVEADIARRMFEKHRKICAASK